MARSANAAADAWLVTSVRLTPAEHAALKRIAAADRRSLSSELRWLVERRSEELNLDREAA